MEWSFPYCSSLEDGPAPAVFGFPLPYHHPSMVTSLTDVFVPWLFALDLALVAAMCVVLGSLSGRSAGRNRERLGRAARAGGVLLLIVAAAIEVLELAGGARLPVASLGDGYLAASELRPIAVRALHRPRECSPSTFWFPGGWRPER
jgi:hypothetical protein